MRKFKDASGDEWEINLTVGTVQRVKNAASVDVIDSVTKEIKTVPKFNLLDHELSARLWDDELEFWELLFYIIEPQAKSRSMNAEQFGERMAANCLYDAKRVFYEEWADFFRGLQRDQQASVLEKILELDSLLKAEWNERVSSGALKPLDLKAKTLISSRLNSALTAALDKLDSAISQT